MNLKKSAIATGILLVFALALPLRAQSGCTDSPEDPTLVMGLVAGALTYVAMVRAARGRKQ